MERVCQSTGASIQSTCSDIHESHLGTCETFDERQIGGERFNFFEGCPGAKTCTLVLRGGAEQFIAEVERSLHDAIMIVKRAIKNQSIVAGGGACEMEISKYLHTYADSKIPHKQQSIIKAFAKALEVIPRQLCDNAGFDATDILNRLRVDFQNEGVRDNMAAFVWEPSLVKINAIQAATEASCLILSVDETISKWQPPYVSYQTCTNDMNREPGIPGSPSPWPTTSPWCRPKGDARQRKRYAQKVNKFCQPGNDDFKSKASCKIK
jgi:T-complex protein 1 subunit eta